MSNHITFKNTILAVLLIALLPINLYASRASSRRELMRRTLALKLERETGIPADKAPTLPETTAPAEAVVESAVPQIESKVETIVQSNLVSGDDQLLQLIPADSLFCVRVNNLDAALASMDQYLAGASYFQVTGLAKMKLGEIVNDPMLTGINTGGDFAIFAVADPSGAEVKDVPKVAIGLILPITGADFTDKRPESKLLNENFALMTFNARPETHRALVEKTNGGNLISLIEADEYYRATTAPMWAYGNMPQIVDEYGQYIAEAFDKAKQQIQKSQEMLKNTPNASQLTIDVSQFMDMYFDMAEMLLAESEFVSITLTPSPDQLDLQYTFAALPDTRLSTWLVGSSKTSGYKLAGALSGTDAINLIGKMDKKDFRAMNEFVMDIFTKGGNQDLNKKWKSLMDRSLDLTGDEMAVSFSLAPGQPPFTFVEVVAINDGPAYRELMDESWAMANDMYKSMGLPMSITYEEGTDSYAGYSIDTAKINFDLPQDDPAAATINQMYGESLEYKMAVTDKAIIMAMGPDADDQLKAMIDKLKSVPSAPQADLKIAFDIIPGAADADFVGSYNILRMLSMISEMMKSQPIPPEQAMMFNSMLGDLDIQTQSCIAVAGSAADGKLNIHAAMPKEHFNEIMSVVTQIQTKMMQEMMKLPQNSSTTPIPVPVPES